MTCEIKNRENLITRYLNQEMTEAEMLEFEAHYFGCKTCYNDIQLLEGGIQVIKAEGDAAFASKEDPWYIHLKNNIMNTFTSELPSGGFRPNYGRLAFTLVFCSLLIFAPLLYQDYKTGQMYSENFEPHDFLESHMAQSQRSELLAMELTPGSDENFNSDIHFQWQPRDGETFRWRSQEDTISDGIFF